MDPVALAAVLVLLAATGATIAFAWTRRRRVAVTLLAVNAPLAPTQGFAVALCILVAIGLVPLLAVRSRVA